MQHRNSTIILTKMLIFANPICSHLTNIPLNLSSSYTCPNIFETLFQQLPQPLPLAVHSMYVHIPCVHYLCEKAALWRILNIPPLSLSVCSLVHDSPILGKRLRVHPFSTPSDFIHRDFLGRIVKIDYITSFILECSEH